VIPSPTVRLLDDGHIEFGHTCTDGERVVGVLPMPPWRVTQIRPRLEAEPSVNCAACGLHGWVGNPRWTELPAERMPA
jgi:hypothetical protein